MGVARLFRDRRDAGAHLAGLLLPFDDRPQLGAEQAARLAVMLPRPKYFEKVPNSGYLSSRAGTIVARMGDAVLP